MQGGGLVSYSEEIRNMLNNEWLDKLFGYSYNRLHERSTAEELTQEICVVLLCAAGRVEHIENIHAWIWSIAKYTYFKFVRRTHYIELNLEDCEDLVFNNDFEANVIHVDELNRLRYCIAELSTNYRDIIIKFYIYEKSVSEIAVLFNLPENTVKWRLHEARKVLIRNYYSNEKGCNRMNTIGEKAYNPQKFSFISDGWYKSQSDEALVYNNVGRAIMQNILLEANCYEKSTAELSKALGIPVAYIEDELRNAVELGLIRKVGNDKYLTNFIIMPSDTKARYSKIHTKYAPYFLEKYLKVFYQKSRVQLKEKLS